MDLRLQAFGDGIFACMSPGFWHIYAKTPRGIMATE